MTSPDEFDNTPIVIEETLLTYGDIRANATNALTVAMARPLELTLQDPMLVAQAFGGMANVILHLMDALERETNK